METKEFTSRRVFMMSLPIFLELLLQLLVGNADQAMLSSYSQNSVGAVGNANQIINIAILVLNMLCTGATVLASQSLGAGDKRRVSVVSSVSALLVLLFGLLLSAVLLLFPEPLFRLISVPDTLIAEAAEYTRLVTLCLAVQGAYMLVCAILRSYGLVKEVLLTAVVMNTLNIGLNALLINGFCGFPRLGAAGAAISTDVSKVVGFALALVFLYKRTDARFLPRLLAKPFPVRELRSTLAISLPCGSEIKQPHLSFVKAFKKSVLSSVYAFLFILGYMLIFQFFVSFLQDVFPQFSFDYLKGILEFSSGSLKIIHQSKKMLRFVCFFLSFSGFSVMMQADNLLEAIPYSFKKYFLSRLYHGILSFILCLLFLQFGLI